MADSVEMDSRVAKKYAIAANAKTAPALATYAPDLDVVALDLAGHRLRVRVANDDGGRVTIFRSLVGNGSFERLA